MKILYLIRHGNIERKECGMDYFIRLTELGKKQAISSSNYVLNNCYDESKNNILISSNTLRTLETSIIFSEALKLKLNIFDNTQELDMGYNDGKEKKDWLYVLENGEFTNRKGMSEEEKFKVKHYFGESPQDVYERLKPLYESILKSNNDNYYIIGHGTSLRILTMLLSDLNPHWYYEEPIPENCSVRKLVLNNNKIINNNYIY